jgi:hypothetical protein
MLLCATPRSPSERRFRGGDPVDGIVVRRRYRQTRRIGGGAFTWCALDKRSGRGEGSSGLAFGQVVQKPPKKG